MADVFISYHESSAGKLAAQIAATLEANGISCWYAKRDIPTGADFARTIPPQIDACKVFLLILNENAQNSKHIESELGLAFRRSNRGEKITIFPVQIEDFEPESWLSYYLIHAQIMKAPVLDAEHLQKLARRIAKLLKPSAMPTNIINHGKCGENVRYKLDKNGILTISGEGAMWDFDDNFKGVWNMPWWKNREIISHVEIQNGVTTIGIGSFYDCTGLKSVHISNSVTLISHYAFNGCTNVKSITIPDGVTYIGYLAFQDCAALTSITIPDSVTSIGHLAFGECTRLYQVTIPNSVTSIHKFTFRGCATLNMVEIPDSVTYIGEGAFFHCTGLKNIYIPDNVNYIGRVAFGGCIGLCSYGGGVSIPAKAKIDPDAFPDGVWIDRRP